MARFVVNKRKVRILKARGGAKNRSTYATDEALNKRMAAAVRVSYTKGIESFKSKVPKQSIYDAVKQAYFSGKYEHVMKVVPWDDLGAHMDGTFTTLVGAAGKGAKAAKEALPVAVNPNVLMGHQNPFIRDFVKTRTTDLIKTIKADGRKVIRREVLNAMANRVTLNKVASRIKDSIGLNDIQQQALTNFRERELEKGTSADDIEELADKYNNRLLKQRADLIAHTEMRMASNAGQQAVWQSGINDGDLPANSTKVWIVDGFPCKICEPMDGIEVPVNEMWTLPNGDQCFHPPAHPRCYCAASLNMNPGDPNTQAADTAPTDPEEEDTID